MCGDFTGENTFVKRPKASSKCLFGDCYRPWANSVVKPDDMRMNASFGVVPRKALSGGVISSAML